MSTFTRLLLVTGRAREGELKQSATARAGERGGGEMVGRKRERGSKKARKLQIEEAREGGNDGARGDRGTLRGRARTSARARVRKIGCDRD
eukprot:6176043-Pleurochrysis_carterae.AAC.2